jgi:murein DD-endopeptidase MepM/ murein hydrolase activator NlpD
MAAILVLCVIGLFVINDNFTSRSESLVPVVSQPESTPSTSNGTPEPTSESDQPDQSSQSDFTQASDDQFLPPLDDYKSRVLHKPHGIYINPATSPVQPEKFSGYHVGIDFEILAGEQDAVVEARAICDGKLAVKRTAQGYGGLVAQYCVYQGQPVLVLYGHVALSSVEFSLDDDVKAGQVLGRLGQPGPETDGERKHLHLGIRRGQELVISGYVQSESALFNYIDPMRTF